MLKKICFFLLLAVMLSGCAVALPVAQYTIGAVDLLSTVSTSGSSSSRLVLGQEIERHNVGNYEVVLSDGMYQKNPSFIFMAYKNGRGVESLYYDKQDREDMEKIKVFKQMNESDKKRFIKERFYKIAKLDLGPVEEEESPKTATSYSPSFPMPSFAPKR
jgi:hypothetical protein